MQRVVVHSFTPVACRVLAIVLGGALGFIGPSQAQPASRFALSAELAVPANAAVVRVSVPTEVLAGLHSSQGDDLRVVNGNDAMLPFAIMAEQASPLAAAPVQTLPGYPIYAHAALARETPSLRITEQDGQRLVELGGAAAPLPQQRLRGLLYDTRAVEEPVRSIVIRGDLPRNELLHASLMSSRDLKDWQPVALRQPLFQFDDEGPGNSRIRLPAPLSLKDQYLRLSWTDTEQFPEAAIGLEFEPAVLERAPDAWPLGPPVRQGEDFAEWLLPSGYAVQALRLHSQADNSLMPVRILTRERDDQPWRTVTHTVVYHLPAQAPGPASAAAGINMAVDTASDTAQRRNPALPLASMAGRLAKQLRIEAEHGFSLASNPIELALDYTPMQLVFVASGQGPYRLLAGAGEVPAMRLPLSTVMPGYQPGLEQRLPEAQLVAVHSLSPAATQSTAWMAAWLNQRMLLWAVLLAAVLVLGAIAVSLLRAANDKQP